MAFDPDAYLAQKPSSGFDPDAYLGQKPSREAEIPSSNEPKKQTYDVLGGATKVAQATGIGAVAGALAPELVTGVGMGMMAIPPVAPFAPFVMGAGRAMRGARMTPFENRLVCVITSPQNRPNRNIVTGKQIGRAHV